MSYSQPAKPEWSTPIKEGESVPSVVFKTRVRIESEDENPFDWKDVTSDDLFKGKRTVLFALPGAFTPTCESISVLSYYLHRKLSCRYVSSLKLTFFLVMFWNRKGSTTHVPGYHAAYDEIKSLGIDEVYCLSVNDAFVMRQWGLKQG